MFVILEGFGLTNGKKPILSGEEFVRLSILKSLSKNMEFARPIVSTRHSGSLLGLSAKISCY